MIDASLSNDSLIFLKRKHKNDSGNLSSIEIREK